MDVLCARDLTRLNLSQERTPPAAPLDVSQPSPRICLATLGMRRVHHDAIGPVRRVDTRFCPKLDRRGSWPNCSRAIAQLGRYGSATVPSATVVPLLHGSAAATLAVGGESSRYSPSDG